VNSLILHHESIIRFGFFGAILIMMAAWELLAPRRTLTTSKAGRWFSNLAIVLIDNLALRLLAPATAVSMAVLAQKNGWGLLNNILLPNWMAIITGPDRPGSNHLSSARRLSCSADLMANAYDAPL
jgi:hypothetical protein